MLHFIFTEGNREDKKLKVFSHKATTNSFSPKTPFKGLTKGKFSTTQRPSTIIKPAKFSTNSFFQNPKVASFSPTTIRTQTSTTTTTSKPFNQFPSKLKQHSLTNSPIHLKPNDGIVFNNSISKPLPGFVARGSRPRNPFIMSKNLTSIQTNFNGINFRPLFVRPEPETNHLLNEDMLRFALLNQQLFNSANVFRQTNKRKIISSFSNEDPLLKNSFKFGNINSRKESSSEEDGSLNDISSPNRFMEPPTQPFLTSIPFTLQVPHHGSGITFRNNEHNLHTHPLNIKPNVGPILEGPQSLFVSQLGHHHFFIPSKDLMPPERETTNLKSSHREGRNQKHRHMTMVFPKRVAFNSQSSQEESHLHFNPDCPHCHPAFLKPGECTPCVRIR